MRRERTSSVLIMNIGEVYVKVNRKWPWCLFAWAIQVAPTFPGQVVFSRATNRPVGVVIKLDTKKNLVMLMVNGVMLWKV